MMNCGLTINLQELSPQNRNLDPTVIELQAIEFGSYGKAIGRAALQISVGQNAPIFKAIRCNQLDRNLIPAGRFAVLANTAVNLPIEDHLELVALPVRRYIDPPGWAKEKELDGKLLLVRRQTGSGAANVERGDSVPEMTLRNSARQNANLPGLAAD
jgi:hypothetical protein